MIYQSTRNFTLISKMYTFISISCIFNEIHAFQWVKVITWKFPKKLPKSHGWSSIRSFGLLTNFWCWDRFSLTLLMRFRNLVCPTGGLYRFTGAILEAELTKNLIFRPFGPPEWSSIHSFGLLTNFWCWDRFSLTFLMRFRNLVCPTGGLYWFTGAILEAELTKNLIFRPFGPPEWSSIRSFGLLINFWFC